MLMSTALFLVTVIFADNIIILKYVRKLMGAL
jgi:hypothetical protein